MSISSITPNTSSLEAWQNTVQQRRQDFSQLAQALQSGDLAGAQTAYANLQSLQQNSQTGSNPTSGASGNPLQNDFAALGQALASGNLSQAQSDFAQLQSDFKSALQNAAGSLGIGAAHRGHHHHHPVASSQDSNSTNTTPGNNSQPNTTSGPGASLNITA